MEPRITSQGRPRSITTPTFMCRGRDNCEMLASLIRGIDEKKAQLDRLRPLSGGVLAQLQKYYDIELTHTSNAIEGNTLTTAKPPKSSNKASTSAASPCRSTLRRAEHYKAL